MSAGDQFLVRDTRMPGHFWADNEVLDTFGPLLGAHGFAVYMALCRVAINGTGECRISKAALAKKLNISKGGAFNALELIVQLGLAQELSSGDPRNPATYILADVKAKTNHDYAQLRLASVHGMNAEPANSVHGVNATAHPVTAKAHQVNAAFTPRTPNKEVKTSSRLKTKTQNNTPCGALQDWLAIKAEIQATIPDEEYQLWLRPMYLLKVLGSEGLLLSVPPNGRIMEAAAANRELVAKHAKAHGYNGIALTRYPDDYQRERIRNEFPEFYEQMLGNKEANA